MAVNPNYTSVLAPYDLTRGGSDYWWLGRTDVKEMALYAEDSIKVKNWNFNVGLREDLYNGLTKANQIEPRVGVAYNVENFRYKSVVSISYARSLETPFNENLVLSSNGCSNAVLSPLLACNQGVSGNFLRSRLPQTSSTPSPQQQLGKNVLFSGEYIWKYTHNAFDFSVLGNTPITFPIDWHNSKIPDCRCAQGVNFHNFTACSRHVVSCGQVFRLKQRNGATSGATQGSSLSLPHR